MYTLLFLIRFHFEIMPDILSFVNVKGITNVMQNRKKREGYCILRRDISKIEGGCKKLYPKQNNVIWQQYIDIQFACTNFENLFSQ